MTGLAFLHTADVHVATFDALRDELAPGLPLRHHVVPPLLAQARSVGCDDPAVIHGVEAAMGHAAAEGAGIVVCTCSTIGGVAEAMATGGRFIAMRIDRAMADQAVQHGGRRIAIVAALESTLAPTQTLVRDSARRCGREVTPTLHHLADAWPHFERGDTAAYHAVIAEGIAALAAAGHVDVILLAQASMDGAVARYLARQPVASEAVPVLSSPRTGFAAALAAMRSN